MKGTCCICVGGDGVSAVWLVIVSLLVMHIDDVVVVVIIGGGERSVYVMIMSTIQRYDVNATEVDDGCKAGGECGL